MKFLWVAAVCLLFFSGCAHVEVKQDRESGLKAYAQGLIYEQAEKQDEAIEYYKRALREAGESSHVYVKLGNLYLKKQDTVNAKDCFFRAVKIDAGKSEAFFGLGVAYLVEKNNRLAAKYMEKGLALDPENQSVRMLLCDIYVGMNMLKEALAHYRILLDAYPGNYVLHYNNGNILERLGDVRSAEKSYLKTVELADFFWKGHFSLGLLYSKQGRNEDAIRHFVRAIEINPKDSISYSLLTGIYYREGNNEKAKYYLNKAIDNGFKTSEFYNFLGIIATEEEDYAKAEEFLREGIKIKDTSTGRFYLGTLYEKTGDKEKMETEMRRALEIDPDDALVLNYLGYTYLTQDRNIEEAYRMIKKACSIEPDNGAYLDSLGWAYYKMGKYDTAREYLERAAEMEKDAEIFEHLGYLYTKLEDYARALYWFVRSYEIGGDADLLKIIEEVKQKNLK